MNKCTLNCIWKIARQCITITFNQQQNQNNNCTNTPQFTHLNPENILHKPILLQTYKPMQRRLNKTTPSYLIFTIQNENDRVQSHQTPQHLPGTKNNSLPNKTLSQTDSPQIGPLCLWCKWSLNTTASSLRLSSTTIRRVTNTTMGSMEVRRFWRYRWKNPSLGLHYRILGTFW